MGIENSFDSQYFLESYRDGEIAISPSDNQYGMLVSDEFGNIINSGLIGGQSVYKCSAFTGIDSGKYVLFYNSDKEMLGMIKGTFDKETNDYFNIKNNFVIQNQVTIYYKINVAVEEEEFSRDTVVFSNLKDNVIYKVYLNGEEETLYTRSDNTLVFDSGIAATSGNSVYIIYYPADQDLAAVSVKLHYYTPVKHEITDNDELKLGFDLGTTASVTVGSNIITTLADISDEIELYEELRVGAEVKKILHIDGETIKMDSVFTNTYVGTTLYRTPYKMFLTIESPSEDLSPSFYTFETKGIKMPIQVKEKIDNKFNFDYYINNGLTTTECNLYNYITQDVQKYLSKNNRMRIIRAYYQDDELKKFIYLTNIRKINSFNYSKNNDADKYNASLQFEDKLTLIKNEYSENTTTQLTGTVSISSGTNGVTGTDTLFSSEISSGDLIKVEDELKMVDTVSSNTSLATKVIFTSVHSGQDIYKYQIDPLGSNILGVGGAGNWLMMRG